MGYATNFMGAFKVTPALKEEHKKYLNKFSETRRMQRNAELTAERSDLIRDAVALDVGYQGGYFVGESGVCGQDKGHGVLDTNRPPSDQPGLWCQWIPNEDGTAIKWDGYENFYQYVEWIEYLIKHFLAPWGYTLEGEVMWQGEGMGDVGKIFIKDNVVKVSTVIIPDPEDI